MSIEEENIRKYGKPPTIQQINSFVEQVGLSLSRFEKFFAIAPACLRNVRYGTRPLPVKYWHIFYERVIPEVGVGYVKAPKTRKKRKSPQKPVSISVSVPDKPEASQTPPVASIQPQGSIISHPALSKLR